MALGFMMIPAPTVASLGARSSTTTGSPTIESSCASESPPMPPPTTMVERGIGGRSSGGQAEQRGHPPGVEHSRHRLVRRALLEAARRVENLGQEGEVADGVQEDSRHPEHTGAGEVEVRIELRGRLTERRDLGL